MNVVDISVVGLVFVSILMGLIRGFTKEFLSLISWIGAITSTLMFWPLVQHVSRQYISHPMLADGATILVLFVLFLILFSLISYFLANLVRHSVLGGVDRSLGTLFGVFRGVTVICLIELFISCFVARANHPDIIKASRFINQIYKGSDLLFTLLPSNLQVFIKTQQAKYSDVSGNESVAQAQAAAAKAIVGQTVEAAVADIAQLKPKVAPQEEQTQYSKKQRQDMERLLIQDEEPPTPVQNTPPGEVPPSN